MENQFAITHRNREILLHYLTAVSEEKLFAIPEGFNNNIWWNIAHTVVTQQVLVYKFSGLPMMVNNDMVAKYMKGTFPTGTPSPEEIATVKELLFSTVKQTEKDYSNGVFKTFSSYTTSAKFQLDSVEDAITFNVYHEALHIGAIIALLKKV